MSTHTADVIKIDQVLEHNNADALEVIPVYDYQCVVKKGTFKVGDLGVFFHPETMLDTTREEFAFLAPKAKNDRARIRVVKLRGEKSYGLLIPAPGGVKEGENVFERYNCQWYEPVVRGGPGLSTGLQCKAPGIVAPVPDPENIRKFNKKFAGHDVIVTTKLHGSFFRATFQDGKFHVGSKSTWRYEPGTKLVSKEYLKLNFFQKIVNFFTKKVSKYGVVAGDNSWWTAFESSPWLKTWLEAHPGATVMGEIVGPKVQKGFNYGLGDGEYAVYVFAIHMDGGFVLPGELHHNGEFESLVKVPLLYEGEYDLDEIKRLGEMPETLNNTTHIREGVVVSLKDKYYTLKYVSDNYLTKT